MISYAQKIRDYREYKGLSQDEVAKALGITRPTYNSIETGKRDVTLKELHKICTTLGLTLEQFLFSSTQPSSYESRMVKFKQIILNCLLHGSDPPNTKTNKVKLAGMVYLCDFAWYRDHEEPLSGLSYRHTEQGPIADAYYRMIDELYDEGAINIELSGRAVLISANEPSAPRTTLSEENIDLIKRVCQPWKDKATQDIVEFIKEQTPWKSCSHGEIIPYSLALED